MDSFVLGSGSPMMNEAPVWQTVRTPKKKVCVGYSPVYSDGKLSAMQTETPILLSGSSIAQGASSTGSFVTLDREVSQSVLSQVHTEEDGTSLMHRGKRPGSDPIGAIDDSLPIGDAVVPCLLFCFLYVAFRRRARKVFVLGKFRISK